MMKLVEESAGIGELRLDDVSLGRMPYRLKRFQGFNEASGLPVPGLHRIEGIIELRPGVDVSEWIGAALRLKLENGAILGITLAAADGRILSEGHGPSKCLCC